MDSFNPVMTPAPGDRLQRFVGDRVRFELRDRDGRTVPEGWRALLRTNLGRGNQLRREIVAAHSRGPNLAGASWRDLPMRRDGAGWTLELPLAEPGFFKAKAYLADPRGWQIWPAGPDAGVAVHPDRYRTANTIYCAFTRLFGPSRTASATADPRQEEALAALDAQGYAVIPRSGTLRDLITCLPHIIDDLGCRIIHLLPINPTPTTYARYGRFGSPYAALDLTGIDPALVVFDRRSTGVEQFEELAHEVHHRGARLVLDIVINHTGWGSRLQEDHPEWFLRQPDKTFLSPGAWGTTWEDLVELHHEYVELWDELARMFLTWCRRGVDGFRCDAGYKVPMPAWQFIVARVQQEFPEALFLLEGLGGAWEATESLLTDGGMQWAYSELFQNYSPLHISGYLDHAFKQSGRVGLLVHYSETHDNERLAAKGAAWSLLRNRLCALASVSGGFGFTGGVEWLAAEKIRVHGCTGLAWGAHPNLVPELARLNTLLAEHPCFFDGAVCTRVSPPEAPVWALRRDSAEGLDTTLILVNTDAEHARSLALKAAPFAPPTATPATKTAPAAWVDLLGQTAPPIVADGPGAWVVSLPPGAAYCLSPQAAPAGLAGEAYRTTRAQAAWALTAMHETLPLEAGETPPWTTLAAAADRDPAAFLATLSQLAREAVAGTPPALAPLAALAAPRRHPHPHAPVFPNVVEWRLADARRVTPVPPDHWLLVRDDAPFRARIEGGDLPPRQVESSPLGGGHAASFAPCQAAGAIDLDLGIERYGTGPGQVRGKIRLLPAAPPAHPSQAVLPTDLVLLTNGRGGMARLTTDLGRVNSKYDAVLAANLHPTVPVDRYVLAKRLRVWINADGFISPLDFQNLARFTAGPPAAWTFVAPAGDGRQVEIHLTAAMPEGCNSVVFHFDRPAAAAQAGKPLPAGAAVSLTLRLDIEDRGFHSETRRNAGAEHHFSSCTRSLARTPAGGPGFAFEPAADRHLHVRVDQGDYHPSPEWSEHIPHPVEQSRGQTGEGDAYSPGWFEVPLPAGKSARLLVCADPAEPQTSELDRALAAGSAAEPAPGAAAGDPFGERLRRAARAFLVRRGDGMTVIAGYPWFLDWGRDTFIAARGLLAAGWVAEVRQIILTFARFEHEGTLPNIIFGEDASNRDTSDAPLWFGVVCEELAEHLGESFYDTRAGQDGRPIREVLASIGTWYARGTPNRIHMDPASGLIWSPQHFTWMDTNYPACTPRQGYPIEIQALWIRLLHQLTRLGAPAGGESWAELARRAQYSLEARFWLETRGWYADLLSGPDGTPAARAAVDDALRSNCLIPIGLGLVRGEKARACVAAAARHLVVPGALRSLAPLPVTLPLPNQAPDGHLLNNPLQPYWGRYEGDEDTRRKPAYHNGTAWTWTFPGFCEALARAWDWSPGAVAAARAHLGGMQGLMEHGCLGQIPEILDGDSPHTQRGCDAQAWGVTEAIRVWHLLQHPPAGGR